jgi:hypothetical protein
MNMSDRSIKYTMVLIMIICITLCIACLPRQQIILNSYPPIQTVDNDYFNASISPVETWRGYNAFILTVNNKTDKDLEIIWDRTLFIDNGRTSGGFMFEGVVYRDRNNPKPPDVVFAKGNFSKTIWPNNLVYFSSGKYASWGHEVMSPGENGVYLTIKIGDKELKEKLLLRISYDRKESK